MIKNVVIVNDFNYVQGGASKVAIDTANLLAKKNINVYFFSASLDKSKLDSSIVNVCTNQGECLKNGIKGALRGIKNKQAGKEFSKLLDKLNKEETIIHIHGWTKCLSSVVFKVAHKKQFKTVLTLHEYFTVCPNGGFFNYKRCKQCNLKPMSFRCIKCNCDSRNYLFKLYRVIRQRRYKKDMNNLEYGIAISELVKEKTNIKNTKVIENPIQSSNKVDISNNDTYIYIGRVCKEKGTELFCKAICDLKLKGIVVGDGSELEYLKNKHIDITFTGWVDNPNEYLDKSKCLIFPSIWPEPAGLTALNAISRGIPVIVSSDTATIEYIKKYNAGLIFKNNDVEDLKEKIKSFSFDKDIYTRYQNNPYSEEKYINSILDYYEEII